MKQTASTDSDLLAVLRSMFPQSSSTTLRKMLTQGRVVVNDEVVHRAKTTVFTGDTVEVLERQRAEERTPPPTTGPPVDLDVLYEDDALLVVNKPHRLLSVATDRLEVDTLHSRCVDYLKHQNKDAWCYIVHRLDKDTSGVMVLAKHPTAKARIATAIPRPRSAPNLPRRGRGAPHPPSGTIRTWLMEDKHLNVKAVNKITPRGKKRFLTII